MATPTAERLLTAEEFFELAQSDERDLELVDGRVVAISRPSWLHDRIATRITRRLADFADEHDLGAVLAGGSYLVGHTPDVVRGPDASFLSKARIPSDPSARPYIDGGPDLAVEVVSPNDLARDVDRKIEEYLRAGSQRVWVIFHETASVKVYRPDGADRTHRSGDTLTSADAGFAVEGFALAVASIFA